MFKKDLRLKYQQFRKNISNQQLGDFSLAIANQLLTIPIWEYSYYHLFLSISEKKEVDTSMVLSILQGKDKNVVLPKTVDDQNLINYLLTDNTVLKKNRWNIPEPVDGIEVPPKKLDVIFMPLLAFDLKGNRVGYGKGFYDTLLKACRPNVVKIGLSFFRAENLISDVEGHDVPLDYCVTPDRIYSF